MVTRVAPAPFRCKRGGTLPAWSTLASAVVMVLAACTAQDAPVRQDGMRAARPQRVLTPLHVLTGARLAPAVDRTGTPRGQSPVAPLTSLVHPAAVAAMGNDFYIADSGARRLYRLDLALAAMAVVQAAPVTLATRIAVGHDFSLYVLDAPQRRVLRLSRDGRVLATYADSANLARPVALAIDDARGTVIVADQVFNLLVAFHPLGGAAQVIHLRGDERHRVMSIAAFALSPTAIYVSDPLCRCVAEAARDGRVVAMFGHGEIGQPGAIAVDRHARVLVADVFHNSVKVYAGGRLVYEARAAALGLLHVTDLTVNEDRLIIADGAGARVAVLRIAPPQRME